MNTKTPATLEDRLAAAKALVAKIEAQIVAEKIKNDIQLNDDVTFNFGRGTNIRSMAGKVAGMADTPQGKVVAITVDDNGLPEIKRVNIAALTGNSTADARRAEAGDTDPLNAA